MYGRNRDQWRPRLLARRRGLGRAVHAECPHRFRVKNRFVQTRNGGLEHAEDIAST